jgi:uroporphyrinogen decarboxylase
VIKYSISSDHSEDNVSTQLELFRATVAHQPHDKFLYHAQYTPDLLERLKAHLGAADEQEIGEKLGMYQPQFIGLTPPADYCPPDFSRYFEGVERPENAFISAGGLLEIPGSAYHFTRYISPLRNATTLDEIKDFPYPTLAGWTDEGMAEAVKSAHNRGLATINWVGHMYEESWQIRGYEEFLMDMITTPEIPEHILDRVMERNMVNAIAAAKAGIDILMTGDDVANQRALMFQKDQWARFMKSRWSRVYAAARKIKPDMEIFYHSDGDIEEIIPDLIEIGVTILNPVQPECVDPIKLKREYGKHLVFEGVVGTQTTMPFGKPDEVRETVRMWKRELGYDGALILAPTHVLEPEVPIENIMAFVEAARE